MRSVVLWLCGALTGFGFAHGLMFHNGWGPLVMVLGIASGLVFGKAHS
jgi:hypothetical protein